MTLIVLYFGKKYLISKGIVSESSTIPEVIRAVIQIIRQGGIPAGQTA